jgi:hypothetical protein
MFCLDRALKSRDIISVDRSERRHSSLLRIFSSVLKPGNACYYSAQNLLSYSLLSKHINITSKIYRTIVLPVVLYGCKIWSPTLKEERRLRVFENMC